MKSLDKYLEDNPYTKHLKKSLTHKRYDHTLRVAQTAYDLATAHKMNHKSAVVAALLHDCAKNYTQLKQLHLCEKHKIKLSKAEHANADLLHAKVGAVVAREHYHVYDADILDAIRHHTTGRPQMSPLEQLIFISDYIEPHRKHDGRLEEIRQKAKEDLDQTMVLILEDTLEHLKKKSKAKDPKTKETYLFYKALCD